MVALVLCGLGVARAAEPPAPSAPPASTTPTSTAVVYDWRAGTILHLAFLPGWGFGLDSGRRLNLGAGFLIGALRVPRGRDARAAFGRGFVTGLSGQYDFASGHGFLAGELGYSIIGGELSSAAGLTAGPLVRVAPRIGGGFQARAFLNVVVAELELRAVTVVAPAPELQLLVGLGFGLGVRR